MSTKRSKLFAASTSLFGGAKSGKQYVWSGGLPTFGAAEKHKLQTSNSKLHRSSRPQKSSRNQAPKPDAAAAAEITRPGFIAKCLGKMKGVFGRRASANTATPRFARQPIQGELSLDNVKVMRNDLSDTDFEIIAKPPAPKKAASTETAARAVELASEPESGTRIWNRLTTLLGAGQS